MRLQYGGETTFPRLGGGILKEIWDKDAKYVRSDGILWCWQKINILSIGWEMDIKNVVGRVYIPIKSKTLSEKRWVDLCRLVIRFYANT